MRELVAVLPIVIVIGLLPWLFGGVHLSSQLLLAGCLSLALLVCIVVISDIRGSLPLTLVPLLLAIGLGVVQQFPLGSALGLVSPRAQTLWSGPTRENTSSADGFALEIGESPARGGSTISLYPLSTRHDVTRLLMAVAVFFVSSQLFSHRKWQRPLFGVLAANGAVFAFFGIAQQLVWNGQIYGRVSLTQGGRPFAAFVNSNNAGEFLNLCLAAAIGFTLYAFSRDSQPSASGRSQVGSNWLADAYHRALDGIAKLDAPKLLSLVMLVLIFAGLLCTLSRGAWLAMLVATAVVAALWAASRRVAYVAWTLVLVIGLGIGLVDWLGRTDAISARWGSLQSQLSDPSDGRLAHWPDGLRAGSDFWRLGSGLGTYRHVYRPYAETDQVWFYHAENQFIEAFCEGGVIGVALLLMAIVTVALASRNLLRARNLERRICGVVGIYALVSQSVQACFDFGLYLPANMALFALLCGTVTGANALLRPRNPSRWREVITGLTQRTDVQVGFATLLFCGMLLSVVDLNQGRAVDAALQESQAADVSSEDSLVFITSQIGKLSAALANCPGHAEGQQRLAQLWVHRYRLRTVRELEALAPEGTRHDDLWARTFPLVVQGTVQQYAKAGRTIELENLRRSEPVQIDLKNASRALLRAIGGCPLLARSQLLLAEIAPVISPDASTAGWLAAVPFLASGNAALLKECAVAQLQAGQVPDALRTLHRMVEIAPERLPDALQLAVLFAEPAVVVDEITPNSPQLLVKTAGDDYFRTDERMRQALLGRAEELLRGGELPPPDREQIEGAIHTLREEDEQAVESLTKAVAGRPEMTAWRYELASLLLKRGDLEGAWMHARTCVRMEPENEQFDALLKQLNRTRLR